MSKHTGYTPGPWTDGESRGGTAILANGIRIADLSYSHGGSSMRIDEVTKACNARLIADAPNLAARVERLEAALREILPYTEPLCQSSDPLGFDIRRIARAALAGEE